VQSPLSQANNEWVKFLLMTSLTVEYITGDRFGADFTSRRASSLNRFLLRLSLHPVLRRTPLLCTFLESGDWNSHMKRYSTSSSPTVGRASSDAGGGGVGGYIPDVFVNAFTKLHKTDRKWIEIRERADKLDEDIGHVEKLMARIVRKEGDIGLDYAEMSAQVNKLQSLEPNLAESFASFARALDQSALATTLLKETTDTSYFESLRDLSSYLASLRGLLKSRDQKQLDFEALTDYLSRTSHERDLVSSPHTSGNFIRNRMEDMRGIDHEQSRKDRLRKLELKIQDLTREVEHSKLLSEAFDQEVEREGQEFEKIRGGEMKVTLGELADAKVEFFRKV
jgi:sorting nexin-4